MTCEAGNLGEGSASAGPAPGSVDAAVRTLYAQIQPFVYLWAGEQRVEGALQAHESFDGVLAEHALALEEVRDELGEKLGAALRWPGVHDALRQLDEQITYVRSLGRVAEPKEKPDA